MHYITRQKFCGYFFHKKRFVNVIGYVGIVGIGILLGGNGGYAQSPSLTPDAFFFSPSIEMYCTQTQTGYTCPGYEYLQQQLDTGLELIYNRIPQEKKKPVLGRIRKAILYFCSEQKTDKPQEMFACLRLEHRIQQYLFSLQPKLVIRQGGNIFYQHMYQYQEGQKTPDTFYYQSYQQNINKASLYQGYQEGEGIKEKAIPKSRLFSSFTTLSEFLLYTPGDISIMRLSFVPKHSKGAQEKLILTGLQLWIENVGFPLVFTGDRLVVDLPPLFIQPGKTLSCEIRGKFFPFQGFFSGYTFGTGRVDYQDIWYEVDLTGSLFMFQNAPLKHNEIDVIRFW